MRSGLAATIQRRTSQSYSVASGSEASIVEDTATRLREPSAHHGKMRLNQAADYLEDSVLCIAVDGLHAVCERDKTVVFQARYAGIKQIVWDHSDKAVHFVLDDGATSPVFLFPTLMEVETHISFALANPELSARPEQLYLGVLVGKTIPSPIQQRRLSTAPDASQQPVVLPAVKRREILTRERPPRTTGSSRERLGMDYFRNGNLRFQCSINGDMRGLQLDLQYLSVFPSPDSRDRSACLFMYSYDQIESCEANGQRLEIRFRRVGVSSKQPAYMAFKSYDAQYIRDAVWFFRTGDFIDAALRKKSNNPAPPAVSAQSSEPKAERRDNRRMSSRSSIRRHSTLTYLRDAETVQQRLDSRCRVIGCVKPVGTANESSFQDSNSSSSATIIGGRIPSYNTTIASRDGMMAGLCEEHMALLGALRSPSKRGSSLFKRDKSRSSLSISNLVHSPHYARMIKFQGPLLKKNGSTKYQLTKAWNTKLAALFETPVGGFLCYYDKLAHCPGTADTPKERRVIDLSAVICIRSDSTVVRASSIFAFDVVTLYRNWTFATTDPQEYEIWIQVLAEAVEKHSSVTPDRAMTYAVKIIEQQSATSGTRIEAVLMEIGAHGVVVCTGLNAETEIHNWYFTEIQRWSVVTQHGETCCLLSCVSNGRDSAPATVDEAAASSSSSRAVVPMYQNFLFQTPQAATICHVIEFYVSKCMAKLEVLSVEYVNNLARKRSTSGKLVRVQSEMAVQPAVPKLSPLKQYSTSAMMSDRQHVLEGISLQPIGIASDPQPSPNASQYDVSRLANVASQSTILDPEAVVDSVLISQSDPRPSSGTSHVDEEVDQQLAVLSVPNDYPPTQQIDSVSSDSQCLSQAAESSRINLTEVSQPVPRVESASVLEQIPREQLFTQVASEIVSGEDCVDIEDFLIGIGVAPEDDLQDSAHEEEAAAVQQECKEFTAVALNDELPDDLVPGTRVGEETDLTARDASTHHSEDLEAEQEALLEDVSSTSVSKQDPVDLDSRDDQSSSEGVVCGAACEEVRTQSSPSNDEARACIDQEASISTSTTSIPTAPPECGVVGDQSERFGSFERDDGASIVNEGGGQTERSRVESSSNEGTRSRLASETDDETFIMSSDSADDLYEDAMDENDCIDWDLLRSGSPRESELELPCSPSQALEFAMLEALPSEELDEWDEIDLTYPDPPDDDLLDQTERC